MEVKPLSVNSNKAEELKELSRGSGSKAMAHKISQLGQVSSPDEGVRQPRNLIDSQKLEANLWSPEPANGGVNDSKVDSSQWRRTLACKLFEERHCVDSGGEGMDLLWETYATESVKAQAKSKTKEEKHGQPCCLQSLKLPAGKMNLGMGRPNLIKITKPLKAIGWLYHGSRHGKRGSH